MATYSTIAAAFLAGLTASSCRPAPPARRSEHRPAATTPAKPLADAEPGTSTVSRASVIAFWLSAADTLAAAERERARDEFNYYTQQTMEFLGRQSIQLVPTRSDSVVIVTQQGARRPVVLSGLDYPYGYVLVDPGYAEQILAGVYTDEELVEAVTNYFDLDSAPARITTALLHDGTTARRQDVPFRGGALVKLAGTTRLVSLGATCRLAVLPSCRRVVPSCRRVVRPSQTSATGNKSERPGASRRSR